VLVVLPAKNATKRGKHQPQNLAPRWMKLKVSIPILTDYCLLRAWRKALFTNVTTEEMGHGEEGRMLAACIHEPVPVVACKVFTSNSGSVGSNKLAAWMYCPHFLCCTVLFLRAVVSQSIQRLGYGLDDRGSRIRFPARAGNFSLHYRVQNSSGAQRASYPVGTWGSFPGSRVAEAWNWPFTST
jgi:hypothetical protein